MGDFFSTLMQGIDAITRNKEQYRRQREAEALQRENYLKMAPFITGTAENLSRPENRMTPMERAKKQRESDIYFGFKGRRQF